MLKVFKCSEKAIVPSYSTASSACFDVHACLHDATFIKMQITSHVTSIDTSVVREVVNESIILPPGARALIPTGLKFDIPSGYSLRLHPRSGLAFKNGLLLANCEGIVDEDYVQEVFIAAFNSSSSIFVIKHGDRIAQAELVKDCRAQIEVVDAPPSVKTDRNGGFGSTGV